MSGEFGIVANVVEVDRVLRLGAKVILVGYPNGMAERIEVRGLSRGGRPVTKFTAYMKLDNFRPQWLSERHRANVSILGTREEMEEWAAGFAAQAERERAAHPGRRGTTHLTPPSRSPAE